MPALLVLLTEGGRWMGGWRDINSFAYRFEDASESHEANLEIERVALNRAATATVSAAATVRAAVSFRNVQNCCYL